MTEVSIEDQARQLGWHPLEEFKGDPEKFTDAEAFIKRGQEVLPILQENNKKLSSRVDSLEKTIKDQVAFNEQNMKSQRESMQAEYDKELERMVADGDTEGFAKLKKPELPEAPQATAPEMDAFISENPWYGTDTVMTNAAHVISQELATQFSGFTVQQNLDKTMIRMKDEFPHKFGTSNGDARGGSPVEGGRRTAAKKSGQGYADLPADAKAACDSFIKEGIIENKEDYVKTYDWSAS